MYRVSNILGVQLTEELYLQIAIMYSVYFILCPQLVLQNFIPIPSKGKIGFFEDN